MKTDKLELQYIKGIGPKRADAFASESIFTDIELACYFPRDYISREASESIRQLIAKLLRLEALDATIKIEDIQPYQEFSIVAKVAKKEEKELRNRRKMLSLTLSDGSGSQAQVIFWQRAQFFAKAYNEGDMLAVSGKPEIDSHGRLTFTHPEIEKIDEEEEISFTSGRILPKYRLPLEFVKAGITSRLLRQIMSRILDSALPRIRETLPPSILENHNFPTIHETIFALHFPADMDLLNRSKKRMKFEEIFLFELYIELRRQGVRIKDKGFAFNTKSASARTLLDKLSFSLTNAQKRVIREMSADMSSGRPMNRLLQGDVGSGKTIVALLIALMTKDNGFQTVFMAPTEILAQQHYNTISKYLEDTGVNVALLVGGQKKKMRRELFEEVAAGKIDIIVGTHALFESEVVYKNLGFVIIDEQHRFGVSQRYELLKSARNSLPEGYAAHSLVMSATPIPRTLSMTVYGDLDVSVIDELPKNRKPIITKVIFESHLEESFDFIRSEVKKGRQAYIVYPLVEKSEKMELKSAVEHFQILSEAVFPDLKLGLLHGQMFWYEKEEAMRDFLEKKFDILVATTVIEVGIDVPNASVMLIENSERFGLSQLHQLRGRVGRGGEQSYCLLATKDSFKYQMKRDGDAIERATAVIRLKTMESTNDGFKIAETDLELRGPGDILGERQSGLPEFKFINLITDGELITKSKAEARAIIEADPRLANPENEVLKRRLIKKYIHSRNFIEVA